MNKRTYNLTDTRIKHLRKLWENDPRNSFYWLIQQKGIERYVSATKLKEIAQEQGWTKQVTESSKKRLSNRQKRLIKLNGLMPDKQAKVKAGYSEKSPSTLLKSKTLKNELDQQTEEDLEKLGITRNFLIKTLFNIAFYDINNIIQIRRVACPFCYSKDHQPLIKPSEFTELCNEIEKANYSRSAEDQIAIPQPPKEWYNDTLEPNSDCLNCHGEGVIKEWIEDTDKLDAVGKLVYTGAEQTKTGIRISLFDRVKALEMLCKALRIYEAEPTVNVNATLPTQELAEKYDRIMKAARET